GSDRSRICWRMTRIPRQPDQKCRSTRRRRSPGCGLPRRCNQRPPAQKSTHHKADILRLPAQLKVPNLREERGLVLDQPPLLFGEEPDGVIPAVASVAVNG